MIDRAELIHGRGVRRLRMLPVCGFAALLLVLGASPLLATPKFVPGSPQNFTTRTFPRSVAVGDINNDGIPDLVVSASSGLSILRGLGGGAFAPKVDTISAGAPLGTVVLADFNQDGKLDIAAPFAHPSVPGLYVQRGIGGGNFGVPDLWTGPGNPDFLVAADFNHDGRMDLATCGYTTSAGTASVYLNTSTVGGSITFARTDYAVGNQPRGIAAGNLKTSADFPDLVTANNGSGSITILKNDGTGHFGNRQDIPTKAGVYAVAVGALSEGYSRDQIVTANKDSASVSCMIWRDASNAWDRVEYATAASPRSVALADVNGDGRKEILVGAYTANKISILPPSPGADSFDPRYDISTGTNPTWVGAVNFNGDLKSDLLCTNQGGASVTWTPGLVQSAWAYGDNVPNFSAPDQFGNMTQFSSYLGKWVLLDLCSNWCHPCRLMAAHTQDVYTRWAGHPTVSFEYITGLMDGQTPGIASTQDNAIEWNNSFGINRPVLHSGGVSLGGMSGVGAQSSISATPTLRLIDPQGRIVWFQEGAADESTLVRVLANAAGVAIPPPLSNPTQPSFTGGLATVTYGAQVAAMPWDPDYGEFDVQGDAFADNLGVEFAMTRGSDGLEKWSIALLYDPFGFTGSAFPALPTEHPWQVTLSNLGLDPASRHWTGIAATVASTDTLAPITETLLPTSIPFTWSGGTLTLGAVPAELLATLPATRRVEFRLLMQSGGPVTGVSEPGPAAALEMRAPWPNPARSSTRVAWSQPRAGVARLDVYDVTGRRVRTVDDRMQPAGAHAVDWDLADEKGARVGSGLYFARLSVAGEPAHTQRVTVLR